MTRSEYHAYLESEAWLKLRGKVIERSGARCERRGPRCVNSGAHVHHLTYERVGHERLEDLQFVCGYVDPGDAPLAEDVPGYIDPMDAPLFDAPEYPILVDEPDYPALA